jgi:hypothetical protein
MGEEKQETKGGVEASGKPAGDTPGAQLEGLLTRLAETISRIESSTLDEGEREKLELSRRLGEIERERERLGASAREWESRYKEGLVRQLLSEAAASGGAYRPEQVVALLRDKVSWSEDGRDPILTLPGGDGPVAFNRSHFADGVRAFLAENPNLAAGGSGGGAGSRPSAPPPAPLPLPTSSGDWKLKELQPRRLELEEMARRMKG